MTIAETNDAIEQATDDAKEKSIRNFVNTVTQAALKVQYAGGAKVDNGQITIDCLQTYEAQKERYRHSKQVFKALRQKLQDSHGQKDLLISTEDLKDGELVIIKEKIWPTV